MKLKGLFLIALVFKALNCFGSELLPADSLAIMLDEISVTALKQNKSLLEEPEAYTLLDANETEQLGIVTMRGISDVVPNFYIPDYGSRITSTIYVRGIGARMDQPAVGLNVDNVPYLNKDAYDFDISDIASVVMLRGPQSTLYGRNTIGGVINITTLSPMNYQGWRAFGELGNGGRARFSLGWYKKFNQVSALSIVGDYAHLKGFFTNEHNKKKLDKENSFGLRSKFQWIPSSSLNLMNVLSLSLLRQGGYPYEYLGTGKIEYNDTCFYRRFTLTDGLTFGYNHENFNLSSITSFQYINDNMTLDQDFLPESYFTLTQKKKETSFTEEVVIKGLALNDKYSWMFGGMVFYKHTDMNAPVVFKDVGIRELIENHRNDANPYYPIEWDTRTFPLNSLFTMPNVGVSVYHESDYKLGNWDFTLGLRLDYERADLDYQSYCQTGYQIYEISDGSFKPYHHVSIDIDDTGHLKKRFLTLLPKFAATYLLPGNHGNVYAKISKGYKAGGYNTQMFSDVLQQRLMRIMGIGAQYELEDVVSYKPEKSWNFEVGSHMNLLENKLSMEVAAFYIDCTDQQLTMFPDGTTTGRIMTNAGKTRSYGAELSACLKFIENIEFNASYGYTNARFREFFNGINDFAGKRLPYVPSNTLFLQALYAWNLNKEAGRQLVFDLNLRGTGPICWNEENTVSQKFYALLGASVSFLMKNWEIKLWGKNLTDTYFHTFYFKSMGNEFVQRGRGIQVGVSVRWTL